MWRVSGWSITIIIQSFVIFMQTSLNINGDVGLLDLEVLLDVSCHNGLSDYSQRSPED